MKTNSYQRSFQQSPLDSRVPSPPTPRRIWDMVRRSCAAAQTDRRNDTKGAFALFAVIMTFFAILLMPLPAHAGQQPALAPDFCKALVKHVPSSDVAYKPGVDVHGKPVAPADLPGTNAFQLQQPITIALTADLFKFLKFPADQYPFNTMGRSDINLGTLTVDGDKVLYNGQPLTDEQQDNLAVLCLKPDKQ